MRFDSRLANPSRADGARLAAGGSRSASEDMLFAMGIYEDIREHAPGSTCTSAGDLHEALWVPQPPNTFIAAVFASPKKIGSTCSMMSAPTSRKFRLFSIGIPMTTSKLVYVIQNGSHFVANDPKGEGAAGEVLYVIGQIGLSWLKVLECKQFIKKPSDASEWQTTLQ